MEYIITPCVALCVVGLMFVYIELRPAWRRRQRAELTALLYLVTNLDGKPFEGREAAVESLKAALKEYEE